MEDFDCQGIIHHDFIPGSKTVNPLRDVYRKKHSLKCINNSWFVLHDNAPAHRSVYVKHFSPKNNVATPKNLPYSPADFYPLPRKK
jgi:hypothetical protein